MNSEHTGSETSSAVGDSTPPQSGTNASPATDGGPLSPEPATAAASRPPPPAELADSASDGAAAAADPPDCGHAGGGGGGDGEDEQWQGGEADDWEWPPAGYEYLDHPADVQLHAWGTSLAEAFEQVALAMFGYMTDLETVEQTDQQQITAEGHDLESMLFHFLDEWLFLFSAEPFFIASRVEVLEFDMQRFRVRARGYGEQFDLSKHPQGTEVKAITYSNMQVRDLDDVHEVFVIIDI